MHRRKFIERVGFGALALVGGVCLEDTVRAGLIPGFQDTSNHEGWNFPPHELKLEDDLLVANVTSVSLALYNESFDRRMSLAAKTFSATIETKGWAGEGVNFNFYFWDSDGKFVHEWLIRDIYVSCTEQPSSSLEVGAADIFYNSLLRRISSITYSAGGGWWTPCQ